jgi:hypothetical protein
MKEDERRMLLTELSEEKARAFDLQIQNETLTKQVLELKENMGRERESKITVEELIERIAMLESELKNKNEENEVQNSYVTVHIPLFCSIQFPP